MALSKDALYNQIQKQILEGNKKNPSAGKQGLTPEQIRKFKEVIERDFQGKKPGQKAPGFPGGFKPKPRPINPPFAPEFPRKPIKPFLVKPNPRPVPKPGLFQTAPYKKAPRKALL